MDVGNVEGEVSGEKGLQVLHSPLQGIKVSVHFCLPCVANQLIDHSIFSTFLIGLCDRYRQSK